MITLGFAAAILTTSCWVPQLVRSWRTRSTGDLSWVYIAVLGTGIGLWLIYGVLLSDPAIIAANGLTLAAVSLLAAIKARSDVDSNRQPSP
jgi:MtN3 and saliva related transmembrane protein